MTGKACNTQFILFSGVIKIYISSLNTYLSKGI